MATGNSTENLAFSFDQYGNATCSLNSNTNGPCPQYSFSSSTNQISNSGYTYDASGDLTGDGTHTYQYDAEHRLTSVDSGSTAKYVYNALGQRAEKDVGGTYSEYISNLQGEPVGIYNRSAWVEDYIPLGSRHLAHYESGAHFLHTDALGTTGMSTSYAGALEQDELHYPWGQEWQLAGTSEEERFASLRDRDSETSLDPTQYRMYSSLEYRWFTPDPAQADVFHPQSMSRYSYGDDNPLRFTDPFGLCSDYGGVYTICTTSYNGYDSPGLAILAQTGQDAGYLTTAAPYEALGGIALGVVTMGGGSLFNLVGGGLGIASSAIAAPGTSSAAEVAGQVSGAFNIAAGLSTDNYFQVASGAASLLGEDALSQAIDAGEDLSEGGPEALPVDTSDLQELEQFLC